MKKAASVFLRGDICRRDLELMALWLEKPQITRYLNEHASVVYDLTRLADTVPEPMLGFHLNRQGRFFIICCAEGDTIGFVKLARTAIPENMKSFTPSARMPCGALAMARPPFTRLCVWPFLSRRCAVWLPKSTPAMSAPAVWLLPAVFRRWGRLVLCCCSEPKPWTAAAPPVFFPYADVFLFFLFFPFIHKNHQNCYRQADSHCSDDGRRVIPGFR